MPADMNLVLFDKKLAESIEFNVNGKDISFQFAPKITGERNGSNWSEEDLLSIAPLRIMQGMQGRDVDFEWEYISSSTVWTGEKIAKTLRDIKSIFYEFQMAKAPIVKVKYLQILPEETDFTMRSLDIIYSQEILNDYPVYIKVLTKLQLASTLTISSRAEGKAIRALAEKAQEEGDKQKVFPFGKVHSPLWY